jgi:hypothetical protein
MQLTVVSSASHHIDTVYAARTGIKSMQKEFYIFYMPITQSQMKRVQMKVGVATIKIKTKTPRIARIK